MMLELEVVGWESVLDWPKYPYLGDADDLLLFVIDAQFVVFRVAPPLRRQS